MKAELCPHSGNVFINPENEEDVDDLYEFFGENVEFADCFRMELAARREFVDPPKVKGGTSIFDAKPQLLITCARKE